MVHAQLTKAQYEEYSKDPLGNDEKVRNWCKIPEDFFYSVGVWPDCIQGKVWLTPQTNPHLVRKKKKVKISKSDQN